MSLRARVQASLNELAASPEQAALLSLALHQFDQRVEGSQPFVVAHRLPALVDAAITGETGREELCVLTALIEMGMDLLDHIADGELDGPWTRVPLGARILAATGLSAVLPQTLIGQLELPAELRAELHLSLAQGLPRIGAGQQRDLSGTSPEDGLAALARTGERYALYAELAARRAGVEPEPWARYARCLGEGRQLASDCVDLAGEGRDLDSGVQTWPVAWARRRSPDFDRLWRRARTEPGARPELYVQLVELGAIRRARFLVSLRCEAAREALAGIARAPGRQALEELAEASCL